MKIYFLFTCFYFDSINSLFNDLEIPIEHIQYFLHDNKLKLLCEETKCIPEDDISKPKCWGYEHGCKMKNSFSKINCDGDPKGWTSPIMAKQEEMFYNQADFGYVKHFRNTMQPLCRPENERDSYLECTENLEFCKGHSISIDFRSLLNRTKPVRYHMDVLKAGDIAGKCRLDKQKLSNSLGYLSPLQSWAPEIRHFSGKDDIDCDVWVEKPTIIIKLDATVSMYHHFCDFFNLFTSQHVNSSSPFDFQLDTQILIWETYQYRSNFGVSWNAFTKNTLWDLNNVKGKRVCFKNVMFPLLARGIFGLYYNTPIIPGCSNSGLFQAFSRHFLHRMGVARPQRSNKIHITWLSRTTKYRRIINEKELIEALEKNNKFIVKKVEFSHSYSFLRQLEQDQWTDILVGIHGSGLTHSFFLPEWAVLFEIYACGDPGCYNDLARTRGLHYITWENDDKMIMHEDVRHPDYSDHKKYRNYSFDKYEFLRLMVKAENHIISHPEWLSLQNKLLKEEL